VHSLHVRAHQDGNCEFNPLSRPAQLSILTDQLASEVLGDLRATEFNLLLACRAYLRDGRGHITSREKHMLTNEFPEYASREYLQQRNNWTDHIVDSIDWTAYRAVISAVTDNVRTFVIKISHNWLPTPMRFCD
jgi:cytidylate kinase